MDHTCERCRHYRRVADDSGECHESSPKLTHILIPMQGAPNILTASPQQGLGIRGFSGWPSVPAAESCGKWGSPFSKETVQ